MTVSFSHDWFSKNISVWDRLLQKYKNKKNLQFLEVGCYEGMATRWLLENVLTQPTSLITVIDTFEGSMEHSENDIGDLEERFRKNVQEYAGQVNIVKGFSQEKLRETPIWTKGLYDFIYLDGSHLAADVLQDAVLSWPLLKKGGIMVFDDYGWRPYNEEYLMPKIAITSFLASFETKYKILHLGYQVAIEKL